MNEKEKTYFEFGIVVGQKLEEFNNRIEGLSSEINYLKEVIEKLSLEVKHLKAPVEEETIVRAERVEDTEIKADIYERALAIVQYHVKNLPENEEDDRMLHGTLKMFGQSPEESNDMMLNFLLKYMIRCDVLTDLFSEQNIDLGDLEKEKELERRERDARHRKKTSNGFIKIWEDINKANNLRKAGKYDAALSLFDSVLESDPKNLDALFNRCILLLKLKDYKAAIECFDGLLEIDSNHKEAWLMKGVAHHGLKDLEEEENCYDKALEIDDTYGKALLNKAMLLKDKGEFEEAERYYNDAVKADPTLENYRSEFIFG